MEISSGDLTLDADGHPESIWVFRMGTTFNALTGRQVILANGARGTTVFWQVGSSTRTRRGPGCGPGAALAAVRWRMVLPLAAVLSTLHYEGDVAAAGGDYAEVAFAVPAGTVEIQVAHTDGSADVILDWGVWGPDGFRGWGGGNTEDAVIGVAESSRSYLPGAITPGAWTLVIGKAKLAAGAGHYSVDVTCRDDATLTVRPRSEYVPAVLGTEPHHWLKGDFHVHDSESGDANASIPEIVALMDSQGLDFANLSDHNTTSQLPFEPAFNGAGQHRLLLRGAEITTYAGHANAVGISTYVDHRVGLDGRTISDVIADVKAQGGLFLVNHPTLELGSTCIGCAWSYPDTPWDQVDGLEIITGKWDVVEPLFVPTAIALWDQQLDAGHHIAAVSGSDDHRAGRGTGTIETPVGSPCTLVLTDELSERAIIDAVKAGRTMVNLRGPHDPVVSFQLERPGDDAGSAAVEIGDTIEIPERVGVAAQVRVQTGQGMFVQLIRDGVKLATARVDSDDFSHTFTDAVGLTSHRYRIELVDEGGARIVVTSHIYVVGVAGGPALDESGCCNSNPQPPLLALLAILPLVRRRRPTCT